MRNKIIAAVIVFAVLGALGVKLAGNAKVAKSKAYMPDLNKSVVVQAQTIEKATFDYAFSYSGTFAPNREIQLIPQSQGEVKGVFFTEGQQVGAGKLLVQVDDDLLQSQLIAAKASYENARTNYERFKNASGSDGVTKMQLDANYLQMKSAESQLRQLEIGIGKCKLTAPFAGTITKRNVEIGSVVGGSSVGQLTDVSSLKLEVNVPESDIAYFSTGMNVSITTDMYPGENYNGRIEYVSNRGDESHNFVVKVRVPNHAKNPLKAGMYGNLALQKNLNVSTLSVPRTALLGSAKKPQVFVVENGRAMLRDIITGRSNGTQMEVVSGLREGDKVVTGGQINLVDSCRVELSK